MLVFKEFDMSIRVEEYIDIGRIKIDRLPIGPTTLKYAKAIENGADFPAIKVAKRPDGLFEIRDGRHRWLAHKLCGRKAIKVKYSIIPLKEKHIKNLKIW